MSYPWLPVLHLEVETKAGSVISELKGGILAKQVTRGVKRSVSARLLTRAALFRLGGGLLATAATWTQGLQAFGKYRVMGHGGDSDAANAYFTAGALYMVSGAMAAVPAIIGAGTLLSAAGVSGTLVSVMTGLAFIPVAGWIILSVAFLGAAIYFGYVALQEKDTPLEVWISRCYYCNEEKYDDTSREPYPNLKVEMAAYQDAVYGLHVRFDWNDNWGRDGISVRVVMPGYSDSSDYAYELRLNKSGGGDEVLARKGSRYSYDEALKPQPPSQRYMSATPEAGWSEQLLVAAEDVLLPEGSWAQQTLHDWHTATPIDFVTEPMEQPVQFSEYDGYAVLKTEVLIDEALFDQCWLKFEYWPDPRKLPKLVMRPLTNGADFKKIMD